MAAKLGTTTATASVKFEGSVGGVRFGLGVISVVACSGVEAECVLVVTVDNTAVASVVVLTGVAVIFSLPASSKLTLRISSV